jgi:hypothetical protein
MTTCYSPFILALATGVSIVSLISCDSHENSITGISENGNGEHVGS